MDWSYVEERCLVYEERDAEGGAAGQEERKARVEVYESGDDIMCRWMIQRTRENGNGDTL